MTRGSAWEGLYRPLSTNLYYLIGGRVFDHSLTIYHSLNVVLFVANGLLAYAIARRFVGPVAALLCAAIFVSRQASSELLVYTVHMQSLLPAFLSLAAVSTWIAAVRRDYAMRYVAVAALLVVLALLAKEASVVVCLMFALVSAAHPRMPIGRDRWLRRSLLVLPAAATIGWYLWAREYLAIGSNRWWTYEHSPWEIIRNYVAYTVSFSNAVMSPYELTDPVIMLQHFPLVIAARNSVPLCVVFCLVVGSVPLAIGYLALTDGRGATQARVAGAAIGVGIFVLALAPVSVMHDHVLSYYGYLGHFGLSLLLACAVEALLARTRFWRRCQTTT
jgi:hypothetical protein